jgi:RNA polymerase sigma-70 factor (ECF subfamily)
MKEASKRVGGEGRASFPQNNLSNSTGSGSFLVMPSDMEQPPRSPQDGLDDRYETFVRLLMSHEAALRAYLRRLLPTWHDVEEVAQEASLIAWRKFGDFEEGSSFGGWLMMIARFEALKRRRRMARSPLVFSDDVWELISEENFDKEANDALHRALETCLQKLPPPQRELILQAHEPGVRLYELAQESGRSEQAFYKTIQRVRASLLDCIKQTVSKEGLREA